MLARVAEAPSGKGNVSMMFPHGCMSQAGAVVRCPSNRQ